MKYNICKALFFAFAALAMASCDKDFNGVGADIIGNDNFELEAEDFPVVAYDVRTGPVQTNNLPLNALGIYNDPIFGKTTAHFVTQLQLIGDNPQFDVDPEVTRVELTVPYFSTRTGYDAETGVTTYRLDSIYGSGKINLKVFESTFYLRDFDPESNFTEPQKYFSDQTADFDANHGIQLNDDASDDQNDEFFFDPSEIVTYETNDEGEEVVDERLAPRMELNLNKDFFQEKLFGPGAAGQFINNNQFQQYFRGLYFRVDHAMSNPAGGSMAVLNFRQGKVTVYYKAGTGEAREEERTFVLNLTGNTVNLLQYQENPAYLDGITNSDPVAGDSRIYLHGGAGSVGVVRLFAGENEGDPANNLSALRNGDLMINDASLYFSVDRTALPSDRPNPLRVFLYDIENKQPLADYDVDITTISGFPQQNKYIHDGLYNRFTDKYRVRLTNHIRKLIQTTGNDSINVTLGISLMSDVGNIGMAALKDNVPALNNVVPVTSVMHPRATILHGSNLPADDPKRIRFKIHYTKPITE